MQHAGIALFLATTLLLPACRKPDTRLEAAPAATRAEAPQPAPTEAKPAAAPAKAANVAKVGEPAPDFALPDLDGTTVRLSDFQGKTVVLEWFNPGCPYVGLSHTKGSLRGAADEARKQGVVWIAINSGAPGQQGTGVETNREAKARFGMNYPLLLDESGDVGRLYGAKRTPHMFVIDEKGMLVYAGAIDNSPDGEGQTPTGGKLVRHVTEALESLAAGREISVKETESYGCTVKYAAK